jgi:hypothetical protein
MTLLLTVTSASIGAVIAFFILPSPGFAPRGTAASFKFALTSEARSAPSAAYRSASRSAANLAVASENAAACAC